MKKIGEWHPVTKHICVALALVLLAAAVFYGSVRFSTAVVSSALGDLIPHERKEICRAASSDAVKTALPLLPGLADYPASAAEKQRIATQALKAQRLECLHMALLETYVRNYYGSVVTTMVFGGIAAIAVFLVGPKGWSNSDPYLVNVLLVSAAIAAFYGAFPGVFQQSTLLAAHKTQILRYEALLDGMASHTATPKLVPSACASQDARPPGQGSDTRFQPADFIACTDTALAAADIPFGLDPKSQPDYQKALGTPAGK